MHWNISAKSAQLRRGQDDSLIITPAYTGVHIVAVFDGHGEYPHVIHASCIEYIIRHSRSEEETKNLTQDGFRKMFGNLAGLTNHIKDSGSTLSLAYLYDDGRILVGSLGDSPVIWGSSKNRGRSDLSHTSSHNVWTNDQERARIKRHGAQVDARYMYNRHGHGLQLTRALGDADFEEYLSREPDIRETKLSEGDFVLLCSDGFIDGDPLDTEWLEWLPAVRARKNAGEMLETFKTYIRRKGDDATIAVCYLEK